MEEGFPESALPEEDNESRTIANSLEDYGASKLLRDSIADLPPSEAWPAAPDSWSMKDTIQTKYSQ